MIALNQSQEMKSEEDERKVSLIPSGAAERTKQYTGVQLERFLVAT